MQSREGLIGGPSLTFHLQPLYHRRAVEGFASQEVPSRETRGDQGEEVHWHPPGQKNITPPGPEVNPKDNPEKIRRLGDFNYRNAQRVIIRTLER
nr:unnamed protein product [Callosobruchus chinensis]